MEPSADEGAIHVVILIHGTWGQDTNGWYQRSPSRENFAARLAARLVGTPLEGALSRTVKVFEWSGAKTHEARLEAALNLAADLATIRGQLITERVRFHFVAHSHGGNVLLAALPQYLHLLSPMLLNVANFPKMVTDDKTTAEFFTAANRLYTFRQFHPDNDAVRRDPELLREVSAWYQDASRALARFRSGGMTFREQFRLNQLITRLADGFLRLSTYPAAHGIASAVFLGTPFYYKQWRSDWRQRMVDRFWNCVGEAALAGVAAYVVLLIAGGLLSLISPVTWIGFNPLVWPTWLTVGVGLATAWGASTGFRRVLGSADTNVYFDETLFLADAGSSPLTQLKGRRLFDALVVSSGYVDEALSGLSSFPLIAAMAPRILDSMLKPKAWTFAPLQRGIGTFRVTVGAVFRRRVLTLGRRLGACIRFLAYPLRLGAYTAITRPLAMSQAARLVLPLSYGLPGEEFLAGRIAVRQDLDVPQIGTRHLDVARDLLNAPVDIHVDRQRFEFLWDDHVLAERFAQSEAAAHFQSEPANEVKRHVLAIEERLREFFGVAGLRHSLYYENDAVLDAVVAYLLRAETSAPSAAQNAHLPSLGAT